jgi:glycyl-tRNA synthetase beta chain
VNILQQAKREYGYQGSGSSYVEGHFSKDAERGLCKAVLRVEENVKFCMEKRDYPMVLQELVTVKDPIDLFFEEVMVLVEDPDVRRNRLDLLDKINSVFNMFADFSKISL